MDLLAGNLAATGVRVGGIRGAIHELRVKNGYLHLKVEKRQAISKQRPSLSHPLRLKSRCSE
ncbi:hypothetical protein D6779_00270 [Candidatus Parcubacteria bacterium]|nr:MAG: hypothetical protein D6779_00270 [Candidatus Parcubacteria bacterium]